MGDQNPTVSTIFSTNTILQEAMKDMFEDQVNVNNQSQVGIVDAATHDLFPEGPKRLPFHETDIYMPEQVFPPDFKKPPQIGCLSAAHQGEQSTTNLKALLASWGMLELFDWFVGKRICRCVFNLVQI